MEHNYFLSENVFSCLYMLSDEEHFFSYILWQCLQKDCHVSCVRMISKIMNSVYIEHTTWTS